MSDRSARGPVALVILDGLGLRAERDGNAMALAETPTLDHLTNTCPMATLITHGPDVGLPEGQMGNSEVGHMNIGAGRVVLMDLPKIDAALANGSFDTQEAVRTHIEALKTSGGVCHLVGLLSPGGVHAHQRHLAYIAKLIAGEGISVCLHLIADGRDVPPRSIGKYLTAFRADLGDTTGIKIATLSGRFFALDRDNRWERVEAAYRAMALGEGEREASAEDAIAAAYGRGKTDEFIKPTVIGDYAGMNSGDGLFSTSFRTDRTREIMAAFADPAFTAFDRPAPTFAARTGMVEYSENHRAYMDAVFADDEIVDTLGQVASRAGLRQLRLAETEKYPHVTFFFNGGIETPQPAEERHMAPSPKVATYDLQPEMSEGEVTERLVSAIRSGDYDLIVTNYANPDMVGHTGDLNAAIKAVEAVDAGLGKAVAAIGEAGGAMLVCADHGNCETMIDPETGGPHTAHTLNEVPVWLVGKKTTLEHGRLADVAPTLLALLGLEQPAAMTGRSLIVEAAT